MKKEKSLKQLRDFGLVMALAATLVSAVLTYKSGTMGLLVFVLLALGAIFGILGLQFPSILRRPEALWMAFGERISVVVTFVIMFVTFCFVLVPLALVRRLVSGEVMPLGFDPKAKTYWIKCDKEGSAKRYYNPY